MISSIFLLKAEESTLGNNWLLLCLSSSFSIYGVSDLLDDNET